LEVNNVIIFRNNILATGINIPVIIIGKDEGFKLLKALESGTKIMMGVYFPQVFFSELNLKIEPSIQFQSDS